MHARTRARTHTRTHACTGSRALNIWAHPCINTRRMKLTRVTRQEEDEVVGEARAERTERRRKNIWLPSKFSFDCKHPASRSGKARTNDENKSIYREAPRPSARSLTRYPQLRYICSCHRARTALRRLPALMPGKAGRKKLNGKAGK